MKIRIVDIHPKDMFYRQIHRLINKTFEISEPLHDSPIGKKWKAGRIGNKYFFAVKIVTEEEWQEAMHDHILASTGIFDEVDWELGDNKRDPMFAGAVL